MLPTSVRHATRSLLRTPVFTITAALTLVIGIAASVAIFAVVNGVLLKPLPYGNSERLVGVWHDLPPIGLNKAQQTVGTYFTYKRHAQTIENIGLYQDGAVNVAESGGGGVPQRLASGYVTASLIATLQVPPLIGRAFTEADDQPNGPNVVLISEGLWRTRYGANPNIIGRTIDVNSRSRQIIGVMPERFRFPEATTQLWFPMGLDPHAAFSGGFSYNSVARLKPGVSVGAAERDFAAVLPRVVEAFPNLAPGVPMSMVMEQAKPRPVIIPLREDLTGGIARTLWIFAAAAGLVLLVACANVANLILVRADGRQRELAVREALGAGRARVLAHFLAESALLAAVSGVMGVVVAWVAVRALVIAGPTQVPRLAEVAIDARTIAFAFVVSLLVAAICCVVPGLRIGRSKLSVALREGGRSGTAGKAQHRLRGTMVVLQIALALVVLAGSGLLLRTFRALHAVRPGFDASNVETFWLSLPGARYKTDTATVNFYSQLSARVAALPGVRSVGLTSRLPLVSRGMNSDPFYVEGDVSSARKIPPLQMYATVDGAYFNTMGIPLLAGRTFDRIGVQRGFEAIISQRTSEQFFKDSTGRAAIGKRFRELPTGPWYTIIGVVGNARDTALAAPPAQATYIPEAVSRDSLDGQARATMALVVKTMGDPSAIAASVQRVVHDIDPTLPTFDVRSMASVLDASMSQLSFTIVILGAAAVVTLLLGAIGLYGVMAYLVTLRTRELGVRIALGAQPRAVAMMMTNHGLVLTAIGVGGGLVLFSLVARFLRTFLFGVAPQDPVTLASASVLLIAIAALASWIPAQRAARLDPASALRAE
jgi:putative ABC transport system permease protein